MQLDHVAGWVVHKDLLRLRPDNAFGYPIRRAHPIELGAGRNDVLNPESHMGTRGVFSRAFSDA